ncbi:homeodomain super [Taxawa tesnikishii (nom. ined.)]|nr:homeodomain super [Dothideales sp. JES 119]
MVSSVVQSIRTSMDQQSVLRHPRPSLAPPEYHSEQYGEKRPCYRRDAAPFHGDGFTTSSYYGHPTFFVPTHYEHQNGKSRKRSNLPKQSTEIMKRWFDENMHNPYPSEEQKRHFAAAAGINLTQVSNWFINHRRRCPELREKRERGRSPEGDDDM